MKPFRFRAEKLLEMRRAQYDAARVELARLADVARLWAARLDEAEQGRSAAEREYCGVLTGGAPADALSRHRNWIARQHTIVAERHRALEESRLAVAQQAGVVQEHFQRVRVLERLRDRAWRRYLVEQARQEAREIDLLAVLKHARRMSEGESHRDS